jgi:catechol 2,3-dioxygenase-like lactoylglutathione lyase family enzyme
MPAVKEKAVETPPPTKEAATTEAEDDTPADGLPDASVFTLDDWPIPPEAEEVEFIIGGELTYLVAWDMETVADFYRPTFEHLGLDTDCLDDVGEYTSKSCSAIQNDLVVNFSLHTSNDKSTVQIDFHNYTLEDDSPAAEIANIFNVGDIIEMENLSFVVDEVTSPAEIGYKPDAGNKFLEIVFTIENRHSSTKIDAFSLWMTIKDPAENIYYSEGLGFRDVDDTGDSFGSHTGRVAPAEKVRGGTNFQVPVDATDLVLLVDAAELGSAKALVALPDTEAPPMDDSAADDLAANIPIFLTPPDAQDLAYDADSGSIFYISPTDMETAIDFYRQSLPAEGWQEDKDFSSVGETFSFVIFTQGADTIQVDLFHLDDDETEVYVNISSALSLLGTIESGEDSASDSGPLTLVEEEGFLVPSDNTHWQPEDWQSDMRMTAAFASPSDINALVELYETELPEQGWEFIEHNLGDSEAHLYFEGDGQEFYVNLRTEGNLTAVELVIRNPAAAAEVGVVMPPSGQGRIYFGSIMEVEVTVTVDGQDFTLPPGDMMETLDDAPYVDLSPGVYTATADIPDSDEASEEVEVDDGEVWTILAGPGGLLVIQAY